MLLPLCHMLPSAVCVFMGECFQFSASLFFSKQHGRFPKKKKKGSLFHAHLLRVVCDMLDLWYKFFPCNSCPNLLPTSMLQALYIYASVYTCTCTDAFPIKVYLSFIQTQGIFVETKTTVLYAVTLELRGKGAQ